MPKVVKYCQTLASPSFVTYEMCVQPIDYLLCIIHYVWPSDSFKRAFFKILLKSMLYKKCMI
jgi:hypothetical protein